MQANTAKERENAILAVASYHRTDFGQWPSSFITPHNRNSVKASLGTSFPSVSTSSKSLLERIPVELFRQVCDFLPLRDWLRLRHINRRLREDVTAIPEYRAVATDGQECLRCIIQARLGDRFTSSNIYALLIQPNCAHCGDFAGFVYLLKPARLCLNCLISSEPSPKRAERGHWGPHYTVGLYAFCREANVTYGQVQEFLTVAYGRLGAYPTACREGTISSKRRRYLVNLDQAMQVAASLPSFYRGAVLSALCLEWFRSDRKEDSSYHSAAMASAPLPVFDPVTSTAYVGLACKGCALRAEQRHVSWNKAVRVQRHRLYNRNDFLNHFSQCAEAKGIWNASSGGAVFDTYREHLSASHVGWGYGASMTEA